MKKAKILKINFETHDTKVFTIEKPDNFNFESGQAVDVSINDGKLKEVKRPFTITSKKNDLVIEFIIKNYPEKDGITKKLHELKPGDELLVSEPFGEIRFKGQGVFIAGGTGVTPFISIFRNFDVEKSSLIFSNKTPLDIIAEKELKEIFKDYLFFVLTKKGNKKIDKNFIQKNIKNFNQKFYICGPSLMVKELKNILLELGIKNENIVHEK